MKLYAITMALFCAVLGVAMIFSLTSTQEKPSSPRSKVLTTFMWIGLAAWGAYVTLVHP